MGPREAVVLEGQGPVDGDAGNSVHRGPVPEIRKCKVLPAHPKVRWAGGSSGRGEGRLEGGEKRGGIKMSTYEVSSALYPAASGFEAGGDQAVPPQVMGSVSGSNNKGTEGQAMFGGVRGQQAQEE